MAGKIHVFGDATVRFYDAAADRVTIRATVGATVAEGCSGSLVSTVNQSVPPTGVVQTMFHFVRSHRVFVANGTTTSRTYYFNVVESNDPGADADTGYTHGALRAIFIPD